MSAQDWITDLFKTIDAMDAGRFAEFITQDGQFRYGSNPPAVGRAQITEEVAGFFSSIAGIGHNLLGSWQDGDTQFVQGEVIYDMPDGRKVTVPFLNLFHMEGEKIRDYLVYTDPTPMIG